MLDFELHQIQKVGASGDEARVLAIGGKLGGGIQAGGALIVERSHLRPPATSEIASTILG